MNPKVTFVVPCYKLAHLLSDCVTSILGQTYTDLEVLIMDDCSPDNTAEVAGSFTDPRVKHIRNPQNLGHLQNYNKGIAIARGKYVWLISADDTLRRPYAVERYVQLLEEHSNVGYVFSPAVRLRDGQEWGTLDYSICCHRDAIFDGRDWLAQLIRRNRIVAASAMARRECYEKLGNFPLNLPWNGDWYLWCLFALYSDVGYFAEPMVCYREHDLNMTHSLLANASTHCTTADCAMPWIIKLIAERAGFSSLVQECVRAAAHEDVQRVASSGPLSAEAQLENWLDQSGVSSQERAGIRALVRQMTPATANISPASLHGLQLPPSHPDPTY
jgi:glycosyltransferase involved in cell wall biosynthesis